MNAVLQLRDRTITTNELLPLLSSYQLLPQLIRELVIDDAIAPFTCTADEQTAALKAFYTSNQITTETEFQDWLKQRYMNREQLAAHLDRALRIEKFKHQTWGHLMDSSFLKRKTDLDQVIFSMISTPDRQVALELYFQLQAEERTFADLAPEYSHGAERATGGRVGPIAIGDLHPALKQLLTISQEGKLWTPTPVGKYVAIVRLEKRITAQMNDSMRERLLQDYYIQWLQTQLETVQATIESDN